MAQVKAGKKIKAAFKGKSKLMKAKNKNTGANVFVEESVIKENPESLDDILFQSDTNLIRGTLDLKEVIANILSIAVSYSNDKRGEIVKISEQIKPTENIEELILSDDPPYVEEIKPVSYFACIYHTWCFCRRLYR